MVRQESSFQALSMQQVFGVVPNPKPEALQNYDIIKVESGGAQARAGLVKFLLTNRATGHLFEMIATNVRTQDWVQKLEGQRIRPVLLVGLAGVQSIVAKRIVHRPNPSETVTLQQALKAFQDLLINARTLQSLEVPLGKVEMRDFCVDQDIWCIDLSELMFREDNSKDKKHVLHLIVCFVFRLVFGLDPLKRGRFRSAREFRLDSLLDTLDEKKVQDSIAMESFLLGKLKVENKKEWLKFFQTYLLPDNTPDSVEKHLVETIGNLRKDLDQPTARWPNTQVVLLSRLSLHEQARYLLALQNIKKGKELRKYQQEDSVDVEAAKSKFAVLRHLGIKAEPESVANKSMIVHASYFNSGRFDLKTQNPYYWLQQYLDSHPKESPGRLMQYIFPYTLAVECLQFLQKGVLPISLNEPITEAAAKLFEFAQLNHRDLELKSQKFGQQQAVIDYFLFKKQLRRSLNLTYRLLLDDAYEKYHEASVLEKGAKEAGAKLRESGLQEYRLAWKLVQASLVRKIANQINVAALVTFGKRQIKESLNKLLQNYFDRRA